MATTQGSCAARCAVQVQATWDAFHASTFPPDDPTGNCAHEALGRWVGWRAWLAGVAGLGWNACSDCGCTHRLGTLLLLCWHPAKPCHPAAFPS